MNKKFYYRYFLIILIPLVILPAVSSSVIKSQQGEVEFLDSHDEVTKLYKLVKFNSPFNEDEELLDTSIDTCNPKNPIKCLTSIIQIGSESVSDKGIAIVTKAAFITNNSFYAIYDTSNSPSRLSSLKIRWVCYTFEDVYPFDFEYDADQPEGFQYKALQYQNANGTLFKMSNLGEIQDISFSFLLTGFSTTSSNFSLSLELIKQKDSINGILKDNNSSQIKKVYGKILASTKDQCSVVNVQQSNIQDNLLEINGKFDSFKTKLFTSFYGIGGLALKLISKQQFGLKLNDFSVNYKGGKVIGDIEVNNVSLELSSMVCQIADPNIKDTPQDILIGSLTIIIGVIIYLSTTLLYIRNQKQHIQLFNEQRDQHIYTDYDHSHTQNPITKKI